MKLRSGRISAIAASVLAVGALTGLTAAAPASAAAPWTHLCVDPPSLGYQACADAEGLGNQINSNAAITTTNWSYSTTDGVEGDIKQANVNLCMQLEASGDPYIVRGASCVNDLAEEWIPEYDSTAKRTYFISAWTVFEYGKANEQCLTLTNILTIATFKCDEDPAQLWGSS
jgi:hypothetical protein